MAYQTYVAEGFLEDCEELVHTLTQRHEIIDWQKFCTCWKEMDFDIMFYGRQSSFEVVEFTEEVLQIAMLYLVTETENFEDQVVGLFIAYAITIIQPYKNLCALRVVPKDIPALKKIEAVARRDNRRDVLMVLAKMYICGKMEFHVSERERAMDAAIRKYFDGSMFVPLCTARRWRGELDRSRVRALDDLATAEAQYMELKLKAKRLAEAAFPDTNVKLDTFMPRAKEIADSLRNLTSGENISKDDDEELYVSTVRERAMKKTVDPMRHLNSVADRSKVNTPQSPKPSTSRTKQIKKQTLTPTRNQSSWPCSSLPSLEDPLPSFESVHTLPSLDDPDTTLPENRANSPEAPFKGFTAQEIKSSEYEKRKTVNNKEKGKNNQPNVKGKPPPGPKNMKIDLDKTIETNIEFESQNERKLNTTDQKKRIKEMKNKYNKKLRLNDFKLDNICDDTSLNTNDVLTTGEEIREKELAETNEMYKGKELIIQSKGVEKHFVEFEVSDIVIRTETDAPQKDLEIEYIDNYTGPNALYEEVCELSDDEDITKVKKNTPQVVIINDEISEANDKFGKANDKFGKANDEFGEANDEFGEANDDMEMFDVVTEDNKTRKENKSKRTRYNKEVDETMHRILRKTTRNVERRTLKQPGLRSKLKKMGILPMADFDNSE